MSRSGLESQICGSGVQGAVCLTDSGTSALSLALRLAIRRRHGSIALPAYGCFDLATAAVGAGAKVVFYDINPRTLAPDLSSVERVVDSSVSAILVVHYFGIAVDVSAVRSHTSRHETVVIEDAAQAFGAGARGSEAGWSGDLGVFSFGRGKGVTGAGGGALVATSASPFVADVAACELEANGRSGALIAARALAQWWLARPALYWLPASIPGLGLGETTYREPDLPQGMSAVSCAILSSTLGSFPEDVSIRRKNASAIAALLEESDVEVIRGVSPARNTYLRQPALVPATLGAQGAAQPRQGILPSYPIPLFLLPALQGLRIQNGPREYPGARSLVSRVVTLPTHRFLTAPDFKAIEAWARRISSED